MKNLFFVSVAIMLFSGTPGIVIAQGTSNLKFINDIAIVPGSYSGLNVVVSPDKKTPTTSATIIEDANTNNSIEECTPIQFKYGMLLNREVESVTNLRLYGFIDSWMDTRYRYGGTTRSGIDCSAFADTLMRTVYNINPPRTAREQYGVCQKISREDLLEGDLVFFNTRGGVSHVGVYLGNGFFVHSSIHGVTINSLDDEYYHRKYIGGGRIESN